MKSPLIPLFLFLILLLTLPCCFCLESKTWQGPKSIPAGLTSIYTSSSSSGTATVPFPANFPTANIDYILGTNTFLVYYTDSTYYYSVSVQSQTSTSFTLLFTINSLQRISYFYASYLFFDKTELGNYLLVQRVDFPISTPTLSFGLRSFQQSDYRHDRQAKIVAFMTSVSSNSLNSYASYHSYWYVQLCVTLNVAMDTSFLVKITVTLEYSTYINSVGISYLLINEALLLSQKHISVDTNIISGVSRSIPAISLPFRTPSYLVGFHSIGTFAQNIYYYDENYGYSYNCIYSHCEYYQQSLQAMSSMFYFLKVSYVNFRIYKCPATSPYYLTNTTADCTNVCANGYYGEDSSFTCEQCHETCKTCDGPSDGNCKTCDPADKRTLNGGSQCACLAGYFENGDKVCGSCVANCSACSNTLRCDTCLPTSFTLTLFSSPVSVLLFKTTTQLCSLCHTHMPNCLECSTETHCTKCLSHNTKWKLTATNNGCQCNTPDGYFPSSTGNCVLCRDLINGCQACTSNVTCSLCRGGDNFELTTGGGGGSCSCMAGFYLDAGGLCSSCHVSCRTCSVSAENCTACRETDNRVATPVSNRCPCKTKHFEALSAAAACTPCLSICSDCTTATTCTSCLPNSNLIHYPTTQQCQCSNTSYTLLNNACSLCSSLIPNCLTCSDSHTCTSCVNGNYTVETGGECGCSDQYFLNDSAVYCVRCEDRIVGCTTCVDGSRCQVCDDGGNFMADAGNNGRCRCKIGYFLEGKICAQCHFSCHECSGESTRCTSCNSANDRITTPTADHQCPCLPRYYQYNNEPVCASCLKVCATCSAQYTCQTCTINTNLTLVNSNCTCISNQHAMINFEFCQPCMVTLPHCSTCSDYQRCTSCQVENYTVTGHQCACATERQYFSNGTVEFCTKCRDVIGDCSVCELDFGTQAVLCLTCIDNFTTIPSRTSCTCDTANNYFPLETRCPHCTDLIRGCITCTSTTLCNLCHAPNNTMGPSNLTCNCHTTLQYHPWLTQCVLCSDLILGCLNCSNNATCTICNTPMKFRLQSNSYCVCIDGYYLSGRHCLPCEVSCLTCVNTATFCLTCNTTALRTFSENTCDCIKPFSDCRSSGIPECQNHTCSLLTPVEMIIQSITKHPTTNQLTLEITFPPPYIFPQYDTFDFQSILPLGFPPNTTTTTTLSYSAPIITAQINYHSNLQSTPATLELLINQTSPWQFKLAPQSLLHYHITPTNNLAANMYSDSLYNNQQLLSLIILILSGVSFVVYIIGLISSKIVATEMVAVMQISYLGLFIINHGDPLFYSLNNLQYTNGINTIVNSNPPLQQKSPSRVYYSGHTPSAITNLNLMLLLLLLPPLISFILYQLHLKSTKYRITMDKYWKLALGEGSLTAFLFILYNYSSSLTTFTLHTNTINLSFYLSLLEILLLTIIFTTILYLFFTKDKVWMGEYKSNFNWNTFAGNYYILPTAQRVLIGIILTAGNMTYLSAALSIAILLTSILIIAIKKPFVSRSENIRSILTNVYSILVLSVYMGYSIRGPSLGESIYMYSPWVVVGILVVNVATGAGFIVGEFVRKWRYRQADRRCEKEDAEEEELQKEVNRKIQEMIKEAKTANINSRLLNKTTRRDKKEREREGEIRDKEGLVSPRSLSSQFKIIKADMMRLRKQL